MECITLVILLGFSIFLLLKLLTLQSKLNEHISRHPIPKYSYDYGKAVYDTWMKSSWVSWESMKSAYEYIDKLYARVAALESQLGVPEMEKESKPTLIQRVAVLETKKGKKK